jgi:nitroreductase
MLMSLIEKRRSIRKFLKREIEPEKIDTLIEAALRSPSSRGLNPWRFVFVTDRGTLEELSKAKKTGSAFLKNAPLGVVVCGDSDVSDVWIEDTSIASTMILLAAESIGLGGCWIQIRRRLHNDTETAQSYISKVLKIPTNIQIESIIAIGYPDEKKPSHGRDELEYEKVYRNVYGGE